VRGESNQNEQGNCEGIADDENLFFHA
jgi:hypothetical protein